MKAPRRPRSQFSNQGDLENFDRQVSLNTKYQRAFVAALSPWFENFIFDPNSTYNFSFREFFDGIVGVLDEGSFNPGAGSFSFQMGGYVASEPLPTAVSANPAVDQIEVTGSAIGTDQLMRVRDLLRSKGGVDASVPLEPAKFMYDLLEFLKGKIGRNNCPYAKALVDFSVLGSQGYEVGIPTTSLSVEGVKAAAEQLDSDLDQRGWRVGGPDLPAAGRTIVDYGSDETVVFNSSEPGEFGIDERDTPTPARAFEKPDDDDLPTMAYTPMDVRRTTTFRMPSAPVSPPPLPIDLGNGTQETPAILIPKDELERLAQEAPTVAMDAGRMAQIFQGETEGGDDGEYGETTEAARVIVDPDLIVEEFPVQPGGANAMAIPAAAMDNFRADFASSLEGAEAAEGEEVIAIEPKWKRWIRRLFKGR